MIGLSIEHKSVKSSRSIPLAGFTIVELLIVIVVIGILAAISIVAYNGIQQRARDANRRSNVDNIAKTIGLVVAEYGRGSLAEGSGCGGNGNGSGWFVKSVADSLYPKDIKDCLVDAGYSGASKLNDTSGCVGEGGDIPRKWGCRYMVAHCETDGVPSAYVFAHLESGGEDPSLMARVCDDAETTFSTDSSSWSACSGPASYCMNYSRRAY